MEYFRKIYLRKDYKHSISVLILVVMEYFRKLRDLQARPSRYRSLNPCCNGILSKVDVSVPKGKYFLSLNPCCNGILSKEMYILLFSFPFYHICTNLRELISCETMLLAFIGEIFRKCTSFFSSNAGLFMCCFSQSSHYQTIMSKKIFANDFLHLRISHSCEK